MAKLNKAILISCSILLATSLYNLCEQEYLSRLSEQHTKEYISFEDWKVKYNRRYSTPNEANYRRLIFNRNLNYVAFMNQRTSYTFKFGMNKFADLTDSEFKQLYIHKKPLNSQFDQKNIHLKRKLKLKKRGKKIDRKSSVDWRSEGSLIYEAEDHRGCPAASYATALTGAMEAAIMISSPYSSPKKLSTQEIIDCTQSQGNKGCEMGFWGFGFEYIQKKGISSEFAYPFQAKENKRCLRKIFWRKWKIKKYEIIDDDDSSVLEEYVAKQPIIASIDAIHFKLYQSGIYNGYCTSDVSAYVLVVGYGKVRGNKYWIVKNSWGNDWGEEGYFRLEKYDNGPGRCGITLFAGRPIL